MRRETSMLQKNRLISGEDFKIQQDDKEKVKSKEEDKKEDVKENEFDMVSDGSEKESDREGYDPTDIQNDDGIYATGMNSKM